MKWSPASLKDYYLEVDVQNNNNDKNDQGSICHLCKEWSWQGLKI